MSERQIANEEQIPPPYDDAPAARANGRNRSAKAQPAATLYAVDRDAEAALLGAILHGANPDIIDLAAWTTPGAQAVHAAATHLYDGRPLDLRLVERNVGDELDHLEVTLDGQTYTGARALAVVDMRAPALTRAQQFASIVADHHRRRLLAAHIANAETALRDGDADTALDHIDRARNIRPTTAARWRAQPLDEFLQGDDQEYDWVIDGVVERTDRVLLTGGEGGGKSTLLRQIGVQAAAGIHPFTLDDITPLRVLLLDLENSEKQVRRKIRPLRITAGGRYDEDRMLIRCIPEGVDLLDRGDAAAIEQLIIDANPDLVVGGPIYKLVGGDPTVEEPAKAAATLLDRLRVQHGFALILETHQPHEATGGNKRPDRPYGASLWKRWPEFGITIGDLGKDNLAALRHWRGARDERDWPAALQRGGAWPWTVADDRAITWALMLQTARDFGFAFGRLPSLRELEQRLAEQDRKVSKSTIERAIKHNAIDWARLESELG